jgi:hypothetical protein
MAWSAPGTWPPPAGRSPRWSGLTVRAAPSTLVRNPFSRYATSRRRSTGREPRRLPLSRDPGARQGGERRTSEGRTTASSTPSFFRPPPRPSITRSPCTRASSPRRRLRAATRIVRLLQDNLEQEQHARGGQAGLRAGSTRGGRRRRVGGRPTHRPALPTHPACRGSSHRPPATDRVPRSA